MSEPINPRDGGYGEIGCLVVIVACVLGAAVAILIEFLGPSGVEWLSIVAGVVGGFVVSLVALDPVLGALGRYKVPRRRAEPIFLTVAALLPGAVTVAVSLVVAGLLN